MRGIRDQSSKISADQSNRPETLKKKKRKEKEGGKTPRPQKFSSRFAKLYFFLLKTEGCKTVYQTFSKNE